MKVKEVLFRPLIKYGLIRYSLYFLVLILGVAGTEMVFAAQKDLAKHQDTQKAAAAAELATVHDLSTRLHALKATTADYKARSVDVTTAEASIPQVLSLLKAGNYTEADKLLATTTATLTTNLKQTQDTQAAAAEAERHKGTVSGKVVEGTSLLEGATVTLKAADSTTQTITTDSSGSYTFKTQEGGYDLAAHKDGYQDVHLSITIVGATDLSQDIGMGKVPVVPTPTPIPTSTPQATAKPAATPKPTATPKPAATATPTPSSSSSTAHSSYQRTSVSNGNGTFTVDIMTFDLSSGGIKVISETANDTDCTNNCAVNSVANYVNMHGGFAGINGTYFCPTAYPDCAGKTNSFYWKIFNSRVRKMINADNLLGEQDPVIAFDSSFQAHYYDHWVQLRDSGLDLFASISCKPALVRNGNYVVQDSDLDDKQRTAKISRAAVGLTGQTLYVVIAQGATVQDMATVAQSLGIQNAINIDAGGSSAMYYNGSYKRGPGRNVPNALVFVEQ